MNQGLTRQKTKLRSHANSRGILLLVALGIVSVPALAWKQNVKAVEVGSTGILTGGASDRVATGNISGSAWRSASFPVENFQAYTSPFGYRRSATGGSSWEFHRGLDMAAPEGSYIRSWWAGLVVKVSDGTACGTYIVIRSGQWEHTYCHMKGHVETANGGRYLIDREGGIQLGEGQQIPAGTRIGRVGMTGRTTGPHLHWALKYAANYVDPAIVLRAMYAQQGLVSQRPTVGNITTAVPQQSPVTIQESQTIRDYEY